MRNKDAGISNQDRGPLKHRNDDGGVFNGGGSSKDPPKSPKKEECWMGGEGLDLQVEEEHCSILQRYETPPSSYYDYILECVLTKEEGKVKLNNNEDNSMRKVNNSATCCEEQQQQGTPTPKEVETNHNSITAVTGVLMDDKNTSIRRPVRSSTSDKYNIPSYYGHVLEPILLNNDDDDKEETQVNDGSNEEEDDGNGETMRWGREGSGNIINRTVINESYNAPSLVMMTSSTIVRPPPSSLEESVSNSSRTMDSYFNSLEQQRQQQQHQQRRRSSSTSSSQHHPQQQQRRRRSSSSTRSIRRLSKGQLTLSPALSLSSTIITRRSPSASTSSSPSPSSHFTTTPIATTTTTTGRSIMNDDDLPSSSEIQNQAAGGGGGCGGGGQVDLPTLRDSLSNLMNYYDNSTDEESQRRRGGDGASINPLEVTTINVSNNCESSTTSASRASAWFSLRNTKTTDGKDINSSSRTAMIIVLAIVVLVTGGSAIGFGIGLSGGTRNAATTDDSLSSTTSDSAPIDSSSAMIETMVSTVRTHPLQQYANQYTFSTSGVETELLRTEVFTNSNSPQYKALEYVSSYGGTLSLDEIIPHYALAVLFYATSGDSLFGTSAWIKSYGFLQSSDYCLWNDKRQHGDSYSYLYDSSTNIQGVLCNEERQVVSIKLGKFCNGKRISLSELYRPQKL